MGLTRHITLLDSWVDVNFLILSSVFILQNWIFFPLYILLFLRCHSWYRTLSSVWCHSKAHSVFVRYSVCIYGHTDGYICSCSLLSNVAEVLFAPWPEEYWGLTPGSNRRAARRVTGVASPCPEFYVREREREYYDGASTVTEPVWVTLYQADGGLEALLLRR